MDRGCLDLPRVRIGAAGMNVVAVVAARMASTRLPGKTLLPIHGRPMLLRLIDRLSLCHRLDSIVVATTARPENRVIAKLCKREGIGCVSTPHNMDELVVDRLRLAAKATSADAIVRVTPDCPLIDPDLVDEVVSYGTGEWDYGRIGWPADYCSNVYPRRTYPDGLDCEFLTTEALGKLPEAEDATAYIWAYPLGFRIRSVDQKEDLSALNWTVNEAVDLEFVRWVYGRLPEGFSWRDVLGLAGSEVPVEFRRRFPFPTAIGPV